MYEGVTARTGDSCQLTRLWVVAPQGRTQGPCSPQPPVEQQGRRGMGLGLQLQGCSPVIRVRIRGVLWLEGQ